MQQESMFSSDGRDIGALIDGAWVTSSDSFGVLDKFTGEEIARVSQASAEQVSQAVEGAMRAMSESELAPFERAQVLSRTAELLATKRKRFSQILTAEGGFTLTDAEAEVDRAIVTLNLSAYEATRLTGEIVPFAASPGAHHRLGFTMRFPIGVVCAITPFNSPLNTVLHKIAPAYAAGNAVVLKPSAYTPLTASLLCETLLEAGMPPRFISLVHGSGDTVGSYLLDNPSIAFYAFTGSTGVGRIIQQAAGLRRTQMELGSIASTIVCKDTNLDRAIPKIANASFRKAGQVCTSVQRLYVDRKIADEVCDRLIEFTATLTAGDPRDPSVRIGPLITEEAACRAQTWLNAAIGRGATLLCGGERDRSVVTPAIIKGVPEDTSIWCQEAFAPLVAIRPFDSFSEAIDSANSTPYGLSVGVFTQDIDLGLRAARTLRFGTVQLNEASSARADVMPFGGVKNSGFGKEGPAYAIREMTEERLITFNP